MGDAAVERARHDGALGARAAGRRRSSATGRARSRAARARCARSGGTASGRSGPRREIGHARQYSPPADSPDLVRFGTSVRHRAGPVGRGGVASPPAMAATRLYVVHGSHPCAAIEKVLEIKGVDYKVWEWTPPSHAVGQRILFGDRTVPGIRFADGEKVLGSLAIVQALEARYPSRRCIPRMPTRARRWWGPRAGARRVPAVARRPALAGLPAPPTRAGLLSGGLAPAGPAASLGDQGAGPGTCG